MDLTTNLEDQRLNGNSTITERGISWASRYLDYSITQLLNLEPGGAVVSTPPFRGYPPPNLLKGYFYAMRALENYLFDQRTASALSYQAQLNPIGHLRTMTWKVLTDSSYQINTGAYNRVIANTDNLEGDAEQIQHSILMDRVVGSLNIPEIRGHGLLRAIQNQNDGRVAGRQHQFPITYSQSISNDDYHLFKTSVLIKRAIINFLKLTKKCDKSVLDLPYDKNWLAKFVSTFGEADVVPEENKQETLEDLATVLSMEQSGMSGGALLRSGTNTALPMRLRSRSGRRAVTAQMRLDRGETITNFIDSLPLRRRRRQQPIAAPVEEAEPSVSDDQLSEADRLSRSEDELPENFNREIIETAAMLLRTLQDELRGDRRLFFNFASRMYGSLLDAQRRNTLTLAFVRNWLHNFFVLEHLSSTLHYLHERYMVPRIIRRNLGVQFAQVILVARSDVGERLYSRVWFERAGRPFVQLYNRIVTDFIAVSDLIDTNANYDIEEDREQLLADAQFVENSGDAEDIVQQARIGGDVDSVELSFRIKFSGLVGYARSEVIQRTFHNIRQQGINEWRQRR